MGFIATPKVAELDASTSTATRAVNLPEIPKPDSREYMSHGNTDHTVTVRWTASNGWEAPQVKPYGDLAVRRSSVSPTASCLHYATEYFEGMKAYRGFDGRSRLFRPDCNGQRLMISSRRGSLPTFHHEQLKYLVEKLLQVDGARKHTFPVFPHCKQYRELITCNLIRLASQRSAR